MKFYGDLAQWLGIATIIAGIVIEFKMGANLGFIAITLGSVIFAIGTKVKHKR